VTGAAFTGAGALASAGFLTSAASGFFTASGLTAGASGIFGAACAAGAAFGSSGAFLTGSAGFGAGAGIGFCGLCCCSWPLAFWERKTRIIVFFFFSGDPASSAFLTGALFISFGASFSAGLDCCFGAPSLERRKSASSSGTLLTAVFPLYPFSVR